MSTPSQESCSGPRHFYSLSDVADRYDVSVRTVRRWVDAGELVAHRFGLVRMLATVIPSIPAVRLPLFEAILRQAQRKLRRSVTQFHSASSSTFFHSSSGMVVSFSFVPLVRRCASPGDKAIGTFRVIRNPTDRNGVRLSNVIKVGIRSAAKTPHATKTSHPRCEENRTDNKKGDMTPLSLPAEPIADGSSPTRGPDQARQGKAKPADPGSRPRTSGKLIQKTPTKQPDWNSWIRWLAATRPLNKEEASLWIMGEIDRLKEEHGIDTEEAGWMLHRRLKGERESGE